MEVTDIAASKKVVAEQIWLHYFNKVLFESGLITEQERIKMRNRINARVPSSVKIEKDARKKAAAPWVVPT